MYYLIFNLNARASNGGSQFSKIKLIPWDLIAKKKYISIKVKELNFFKFLARKKLHTSSVRRESRDKCSIKRKCNATIKRERTDASSLHCQVNVTPAVTDINIKPLTSLSPSWWTLQWRKAVWPTAVVTFRATFISNVGALVMLWLPKTFPPTSFWSRAKVPGNSKLGRI